LARSELVVELEPRREDPPFGLGEAALGILVDQEADEARSGPAGMLGGCALDISGRRDGDRDERSVIGYRPL